MSEGGKGRANSSPELRISEAERGLRLDQLTMRF
jgi:hypothetical protein